MLYLRSLTYSTQIIFFLGFELGASGRLALMAKLAEGTGMKLPEIATQALANNAMLTGASQYQSVAAVSAAAQQQQQQVNKNEN
jgi:hypothetical protein